jgi:hypothetical protein
MENVTMYCTDESGLMHMNHEIDIILKLQAQQNFVTNL